MNPDEALSVLRATNSLKWVPRTGWLLRGVRPAESVADHTYGVALAALLLADLIDETVGREKLLILALLHDLAESVTGDIPNPASRFFPPDARDVAEEQIMTSLLENWPGDQDYVALWREYKESSTVEARLVQDADRLELLVQADVYERAGAADLAEFWADLSAEQFAFEESWQIARLLLEERKNGATNP